MLGALPNMGGMAMVSIVGTIDQLCFLSVPELRYGWQYQPRVDRGTATDAIVMAA